MNFKLAVAQQQKDRHLVSLTAPTGFITGQSPTLENGQKDMRLELVDVLMIDVGYTDVTWSHAWNSVWVSSYRHFLVVCGWLVNIMRGSRGCWSSWQGSQCTLFSDLVLYWTCGSISTVLAPGYPQAPPVLEPKPWVSFIVNNCMYCADIFIPQHPPTSVFALTAASVCLPCFLFSSWWSDFHTESLFRISQSPLRLETLPASLVKVTPFARSGGALEI